MKMKVGILFLIVFFSVEFVVSKDFSVTEKNQIAQNSIENNLYSNEYPVEIMLEEGIYDYYKNGIKEFTYKRKFKVLNKQGASDWNSVSASWYDWYQEKPVITAKVISPEGTVTHLDPTTLGEVSDTKDERDMYTDRKTISGPLPAITVGSVVEEVYKFREKEPFFEAGSQEWFSLNRAVPIKKAKITINIPKSLPFVHELPGIEKEFTVENLKNSVKYSLELDNVPPMIQPEILQPAETINWKYVSFTTASSWNSIAKAYNKIVNNKLERSSRINELINGEVKKATNKLDIIKILLKSMNETIRYTGLEFGKSSIIPRSPDEVLARKYGDCKDKSILLVGLLKKYGIKANVALLRAGYGNDVSEKIPGIRDFNHAIVYIPKPYDLWIDPTADYTPVGDIPVANQNRMALIVDNSTSSLKKTPDKNPAKNTVYMTRDIRLSQLGSCKVEERMVSTGSYASFYRSWFNEVNKKQMSEQFNAYIQQNFYSAKLNKIDYTSPVDLNKPFKYNLDVAESHSGYTELDKAAVELDLSFVTSKLPRELTDFKTYNGFKESNNSPWLNRRSDVQIPVPHRYNLDYIIHIPPGFDVAMLPDDNSIKIGSMTINSKYIKKNKTIVAKFELNTGNGRFNASEIKDIRRELYKYMKNSLIVLRFNSIGYKMVEEGKYKEGLNLYSKLIQDYPREPANYIRTASVFLSAGFRDEAIINLNKALALDSNSIDARMMLGWSYIHDEFGRELKGNFNLTQSLQEYKKVTEIDSSIPNAWRNLAVLNEYDKDGIRYGNGADLESALNFYKEYKSYIKNKDLDYNYLMALYYMGDYKKIIESRDMVAETANSWSIYLTAVLMENGLSDFWGQLETVANDRKARGDIIDLTASNLIYLRKYRMAEDLLRKLSNISENPLKLQNRINFLSKLKRWEDVKFEENKPETPIFNLMKQVVLYEITDNSVSDVFSKQVLLSDEDRNHFRNYLLNEKRNMSSETDNFRTNHSILDVIYSNMKVNVDGNDSLGYRIKINVELFNENKMGHFYVVNDGDAYRIVDNDDSIPSYLGKIALDHLKKGSEKNASKILDWIYDTKVKSFKDKFDGHPFYHAWEQGSTDSNRIKIAASILMADEEQYQKELMKYRSSNKDDNINLQIDRTLLALYFVKNDNENALKILDEFLKGKEKSSLMCSLYLKCSNGKLSKNESLKKNDEYLEIFPDDMNLIYHKAYIFIEMGKIVEAKELLQNAHDRGIGTAESYNLLAWMGLFTNDPLEDLLALSLKSNKITNFNSHHHLNTLATIYAEMGKIAESKQVIHRILDNSNLKQLRMQDQYILARNAETLGLNELAKGIYSKIQPVENDKYMSLYELAQKRLKNLK